MFWETGLVVVKKIVGRGENFWITGIVKTGIVLTNWLTRGSINTKRNGGYTQLWQPIGREK